jgi:adenosylhomocysteine nucleosidase
LDAGLDFTPTPWDHCGIVTGLRAEAAIAHRLSRRTAAGASVRAAAEILVQQGARSLMSFGLAGGLDPACRPGQLLIPRRVVATSGVWLADASLTAACGGATVDAMFAGQKIAATARAKAELHRLTGASAIDLESADVAWVAATHGLPFLVVRAVCDPAERDLPPAALAALDSAGGIGLWRVVASVMRQPWQIGPLLALSRDAAAARRTLALAVKAMATRAPMPHA